MSDVLLASAYWVVLVVLTLGALEKLITIARRASRWHPVLLVTPLRQRWGPQLLASALLADVATISLLMTVPEPGGVAAAGLVTGYTVAGWSVYSRDERTPCRCLPLFLEVTTREGLLLRNATIVGLSLVVSYSEPPLRMIGLLFAVAFLFAASVGLRRIEAIRAPRQIAKPEPTRSQEVG